MSFSLSASSRAVPGDEPPLFTLLSDHPILAEDEIRGDLLGLDERLRVHLDTLRHPRTLTPFTIAIYGDWGTGKTSAMRWLEFQLNRWNRSPRRDRELYPHLTTVWFYPWKYHTREDVWRGIISEVILASLKISHEGAPPLPQRLAAAGKQFGKFLGHSFLHALSNITVSAGEGPEISGQAFRDIYEEYNQSSRPHVPFLNDFENQLTHWCRGAFDDSKRRLVVFVDDLDRCLPSVALEVLEALKLYLNIPGLLFVVGLDRAVIDQIVVKHYKDSGVTEDKAHKYLAKLFQVEFDIEPSDHKAHEYLERRIAGLNDITSGLWDACFVPQLDVDPHSEHFKPAIEKAIRLLGGGNPREFVRLLNSMLVSAGAAMGGAKEQGIRSLRFVQGAQVFLLGRLFESFLPVTRNPIQNEAFRQWLAAFSKARRDNPEKSFYDGEGNVRETHHGHLDEIRARFRAGEQDQGLGRPGVTCSATFAEIALRAEHLNHGREALWVLQEFGWDLFLIPFDPSVASAASMAMAATAGRSLSVRPQASEGADVPAPILAAAARSLSLPIEQLIGAWWEKVEVLDLAEAEISDLSSLTRFTSLRSLDISRSKVDAVGTLAVLGSLESLNLSETPIKDAATLGSLSRLRFLDLSKTQVEDIGFLASLTELQYLGLSGTLISDVSPLSHLSRLQSLDLSSTCTIDVSSLTELAGLQSLRLSDTPVGNVAPLGKLINLKSLDLSGAQVGDVAPLSGLTALESLHLPGTLINEVGPLETLTSLQFLDLSSNHICDVSPLSTLAGLQFLNLSGTKIVDASPLSRLSGLKFLDLSGTRIIDATPFGALTELQSLNLSCTQVVDAESLSGLSSLESLNLSGVKIHDASPLASLKGLQTLDLSGTAIHSGDSLAGLTSLRYLYLRGSPLAGNRVALEKLRSALPKAPAGRNSAPRDVVVA